ncbi:MAG: pyridoxal phosphate-dependent aminotransferase family protein [Steroidobacteraceae bacterium]|jgi:7-keto-8-aminopelargonate synthetase-like enzyme|nr:pyridoxal phosphate-dependent aminotransferase family protein [Steroidobacteraceae bacterium]
MADLRIESPSCANMVADGRPFLNFGGSCYLGLSGEPELIEAGAAALRALGSTGQLPRHYRFVLAANADAEAAAREFFRVDGAIYYATGYLFGLLAMTGLAAQYDVVFLDESSHYNLREGAAAAGKPVHFFRHLDAADLERVMARELRHGQRPLVATDGMFATFGTVPPLVDYRRLVEPHGGWLFVDESHAFGVIGPTGRGALEAHGVAGPRVLAGGSLGKAFSAYGGLALGSAEAIAALWQSPTARGAASGMSAGAAMLAASLGYLSRHPDRLQKLRENVRYLKAGLRALGLDVGDTESPIATFVRGTADEMKALQRRLFDEDAIFVIYSTYVGAGPHGAIRIAAFADHASDDLDRLLGALRRHL